MTDTLERDQCMCLAAANAVARDEGLGDEAIHIIDIPESNPDTPDTVDLVVDVGGLVWTIEHTVVESYPNQLRDGERLRRMLDPIRHQLEQELPPGTYWVVPPPEASEDSTAARRQSFVESLAQALPQLASEAVASIPDHRPTWMSEPTDIHEWQVRFQYRRPLADNTPRIYLVRQVPQDVEQARVERVRAALDSHLPKLGESRMLRTCRSMLVLENRDPALGTADLVMDAVGAAWSNWEWPDRVAFVEPWPPPASALLINRDGQPCHIGSEEFVPYASSAQCSELLDRAP